MNNFQHSEQCKHTFAALGLSVIKTTPTVVETCAAIFCVKCGMFRTKILTFRREFIEEDVQKEKTKTA